MEIAAARTFWVNKLDVESVECSEHSKTVLKHEIKSNRTTKTCERNVPIIAS